MAGCQRLHAIAHNSFSTSTTPETKYSLTASPTGFAHLSRRRNVKNLLVANVGSDNIGGPQTIVQSGECVLINALRYNGRSYFAGEEGVRLSMFNRLTIGNKHEPNVAG